MTTTLTFPMEESVALGPHTTLGVGGPAARLIRLTRSEDAPKFVQWWMEQKATDLAGCELLPLGGGSNLLIADAGFSGCVLKLENKELEIQRCDEATVEIEVGAGMVWDDLVAMTAERGWAGIECLSGIPGCVGAAPVQNIGAYGQEVSETIIGVHGFDLTTGQEFRFSAEECQFEYRDSRFKRAPRGQFLIISVVFALKPKGEPTLRYRDLQERCRERSVTTLLQVRDLVIEVRRSKSMVYDTSDPNHRSAGSFFTNPIVEAERALELAQATGMPTYPAGVGKLKLSAAWLIEHSGLPKGFKMEPESRVGLSTNHVLALTNRGGATAAELLELAEFVTAKVREKFEVTLVPEPVIVGFMS